MSKRAPAPTPILITQDVATALCDCARTLLAAYREGLMNGGEIHWEAIDDAHAFALRAVALSKKARKKMSPLTLDTLMEG